MSDQRNDALSAPDVVAEALPRPPIADPWAVGGVSFARLVPVAASGAVECPRRPGRSVRDCLTCPYLTAIAREPDLTVVCRPFAH